MRLTRLEALSEFLEMVNHFLWDQVVIHCVSKHLLIRLLTEKDLTLDKTLEAAAAMEVSERQSKLMSRLSAEQVCAVKHSQ